MTGPSSRARRWTGVLCVTLALTLLCGAAHTERSIDRRKAAAVKAAYLPKIAHFTTWPKAKAPEGVPIVICVVGGDRSALSRIIRRRMKGLGLTAQNRRVELRDLAIPDDVGENGFQEYLLGFHLVFIPDLERSHWPALSRVLRRDPVLTVGEFEGFSLSEGMIEFSIRENTVWMQIDLCSVERAGLQLSSRFLALKNVEIVRDACPDEPGTEGPG